jgi:hypothetical protein
MSRWITISACLSFTILTALSADAAEQSQGFRLAQADQTDLPRNIELKEGAKIAEDTKSGDDKTRQIVTEGKEETPPLAKDGETVAPADAAKEAAPPAAAKDDAPPPTAAAKDDAPPPGGAPPGPAAEGPPPGDIVLLVQTELHRVGCDPGPLDGDWGGQSREALAAFGNFAKVDVGELAPTPEIYGILKGKTDVVCPVHAEAPPHHESPPSHDGGYGGGGDGGGGGYGGGGGGY